MPDDSGFHDFEPFLAPDKIQPFVHEDGRTMAMHFDISATQSRMHRDHPDRLELDYTRAMMGFLLLQPAPQRILAIGLGGGSLPKYAHRHLPDADITVVEINAHVIALRDTFRIPPDSERFRVIQDDGARFIAETPQQHDVILLDGFNYDGQPEELCSLAFYDACRAALSPGGVLVVNLHEDPPLTDLLCERLAQVFGPGLLAIKADGGSNRIVLACADPAMLPACAAHFSSRWQSLPAVHQHTLQGNVLRFAAALGVRFDALEGTRGP